MKRVSRTPIGYVIRLLISVLCGVLFLSQCTPENMEKISSNVCRHENIGKIFSFPSKDAVGQGTIRTYCIDCNFYRGGERYGYYPEHVYTFNGNPKDTSYLDTIKEHSDENEIVGGGYYTVSATVSEPTPFSTQIWCQITSETTIVSFSIKFRDELKDVVGLLQRGDEITFRGRFYDTGCGFTDCELIG